ncbi:MAG: CPBP family intramembrane metalloprotease [Oscillospiraceae bacterium]|nr:CPBP family intramembrane metalloprotease [Oscillospiraceae bacterium]
MNEQVNTETPAINPKNPFGNETEFTEYNSDYGEIVPQIRMEGCQIPLFPNRMEKSRIRRYENIVGGFLLGHFFLMNVLFMILGEVFILLTSLSDGAMMELPENYHSLAWEYFTGSSSYTAIMMLCIAGCSILVTYFGCRATKIPVSNLFQTKNFNIGLAISYIMIALLIQTVTGWLAIGIEDLLEGVGISSYNPDLSNANDIKSIMMDFIYGVIVAPITEELLVRGFVMKNLCRVSQKFGIVMSAFFFGVWHENIPQFVLAFTAGCFFGYLTVKHNSLLPSIIAHMAVNLCATVFDILDTKHLDTAYDMFNVFYMLMVFAGVILLIKMLITERFPRTTPEQAERGIRVAVTSPLLIGVLLCHIGSMIVLIAEENA